MLLLCKNCGRFLTRLEASSQRPILHPWALSEAGARALASNLADGGEAQACPTCGNRTLVPARGAKIA